MTEYQKPPIALGQARCDFVQSYYADVFVPGRVYTIVERGKWNSPPYQGQLTMDILGEDGHPYTVAPCDRDYAKFTVVWMYDLNSHIVQYKDNELRELVNELYETAKLYQGTGCMRDALGRRVKDFLNMRKVNGQ